jgi:hypothetical protein
MSEQVHDQLRMVFMSGGAPMLTTTVSDAKLASDMALSAAAAALGRALGASPSTDEIRQYIASLRARLEHPDHLNPVLAEQVIMTAYGQDGLIDDLSDEEVARVENLISYAIVRELDLSEDGIEELVREAEEVLHDTLGDD